MMILRASIVLIPVDPPFSISGCKGLLVSGNCTFRDLCNHTDEYEYRLSLIMIVGVNLDKLACDNLSTLGSV
jgi:hypothetical protein